VKKQKPHPLYEGSPGQVWAMDTPHGCWAVVLCVGERRQAVGNFPCVMLACSRIGWSSAKPGSTLNVALGGARAWKRVL
jgi:hypothetical protein